MSEQEHPMRQVSDPVSIPDHRPILVCPTCRHHTSHVMEAPGDYRCLTCDTRHGLEPRRQRGEALELLWCPTCRLAEGSLFWAAVEGRRQCRVCQTWVVVLNDPLD